MKKLNKKQLPGRLRFLIRAVVDFVGVLAPLKLYDIQKPLNDKKRILILNWRDKRHTYAGGAEVYVHELASRWVKEGNYVTLFCGSDGQGAPRHEVVEGINTIRRGGQYFVYVWAFIYYMLRLRGKFDVIIDCHNGLPFFTPFYAKEPVISVVHHIHQDVFKEHLPKYQAMFACWLEAKLMPRAYKYSQYVTVSPSTKNEMEAMGMTSTKGIEIVYNGVDLDMLKPGKKTEFPLVVFLGRLQAYKSVDVLLKAFKQIHKADPKAKLVIAGGGDAVASLKILTKKLKLEKAVDFPGKVTEAEKLSLLQRAWLMANPSMKEGWGITTIEANACATPVVGSDVAGLRDSILHKETGVLVPYGDETKLADGITKILGDHSGRTSMSNKAFDWAQNFHWDKSSLHFGTIIETEIREAA